jgi:hypothetical protein
LAIDALEIWCTISEEDYNQKIKYNKKAFVCSLILPTLLNYIKYHLLNRDRKSEKEDPDSWQPYKSALFILRNLSYICESEVYNCIYELIGDNLTNSDQKIRQSVILAFGTILNKRFKANLCSNIANIIESFMNILINDESSQVRFAIVWVFKKIMQKIPDCILELDSQIRYFFTQGLLQFLDLGNQKTNKKIIDETCKFFDFYIEKENEYSRKISENNIFQSSILSNSYKDVISMLITIALNALNSKSGLVDCSLSLMSSLTKFAPKDTEIVFENIFPNLIDLLNKTTDNNNNEDLETKLEIQENVCIVISHIIAYERLELNSIKSKFLYEIVKKIFLARGGLFSGGISLCTSLAIYLKAEFIDISIDYLNFLNVAISDTNNISVCSSGLNSLSELIRSLGILIEDYMNELFPLVDFIINVIIINYYCIFNYFLNNFLEP